MEGSTNVPLPVKENNVIGSKPLGQDKKTSQTKLSAAQMERSV